MDFGGLLVLFLALIVAACIQAAALLGVMYAMHRWFRGKLHETTYGQFDFDNFQKPAFNELLTRLALICLIPTIFLHLLEYLTVGVYIKGPITGWTTCLLLLLLETAATALGCILILKIDKQRTLILTAAAALIYILLLWIFLYDKLR